MSDLRIIILEDSLERAKWFRRELVGTNFDIAPTVTGFIREVEARAPVDVVLLDHDLGGEGTENAAGRDGQSGSDAVRWLLANTDKWHFAAVHSLNVDEAFRMTDKLRDAVGYRRAARWSFIDMKAHGVSVHLPAVVERARQAKKEGKA